MKNIILRLTIIFVFNNLLIAQSPFQKTYCGLLMKTAFLKRVLLFQINKNEDDTFV